MNATAIASAETPRTSATNPALPEHSQQFLTQQGFLYAGEGGLEPVAVLRTSQSGTKSLVAICRKERIATEWVPNALLFLAEDTSIDLG